MSIDAARRARSPLIDEAGAQRLRELVEDADAPSWTWEIGDRLRADDMPALDALRRATTPRAQAGPSAAVIARLERARASTPWLRERVGEADLARDWTRLPTSRRRDLAEQLVDHVPDDAEIERLIVYESSGTSGVPLRVPQHPCAIAAHFVLLERALALWELPPPPPGAALAALNLGTQDVDVAVYATVLAVWGGAGFVKASLHPRLWSPAQAQRFCRRWRPRLVLADPGALAELLAWELPLRPAAVISGAAHLPPGLAARLAAHCGCPVIDSYATTETGPIAAAHRDGDGMAVLADDIHVEVVDDGGVPVATGERGELCVSGGRNPYLPLLRYRTGDHARLAIGADGTLRIRDLEGRRAIDLRRADGSRLAPIDVVRALHVEPVAAYEVRQSAAGALAVRVRASPGCAVQPAAIVAALRAAGVEAAVTVDDTLGRDGRKVDPFPA